MVPSVRRPTIAMAVVIATAMPAVARPIDCSRNAIWCTRKPHCEVMAIAKGADTLQKARLRSAFALVQPDGGEAGRFSAPRLAAVDIDGGGTRRTVKASGTASARMRAAPASMAVAKPLAAAISTSEGTITTPLKLAPLRARLMASPRRSWNQRPRMLLMAPRLMVAQPNDMTR